MWTVKIGGSLAQSPNLDRWLAFIDSRKDQGLVLVPGGGPFADHVRHMQAPCGYDDTTGHHMAVLAMAQYARVLVARSSGLKSRPNLKLCATRREIDNALKGGHVALWQPAAMVDRARDIPRTWEFTSDSLAGWLARRLNAQGLVLIKSADPGSVSPVPLSMLQDRGVIDPAFGQCLHSASFPVYCAGPQALAATPHTHEQDWPGVRVDIAR